MNEVVDETVVSGEEIYQIVEKMEPAFEEVPISHAIIACLSVAIALSDPDLTELEIRQGVKGASEWICTYLSCREPGALAKNKVN